MRASNILFLIACLLIIFPGQAQRSRHKAKAKVDVFGYYFLIGSPSEFADIDHLHLSTIDAAGKDAPLNGLLTLKPKGRAKAVDFTLTNLKLQEKALSFTTREIKTTSYKFTGTFLKLGDFPNTPPGKGAILEGELTKMRGKTKVFAGTVRFRYEPGG